MYTAFYGLREKPFSLSPDPRFLFFADSHREALAHLRYGLSQGEGFMAITGEVGTGKTTICRTLLQRLGSETEVAFLFNPARSATELLQSIAHEFGLEPTGRQRHVLNEQLNRFLLEQKRAARQVLLIIDEAQNLDDGVLEEVRLLSNLETESSKLIQIILLGQPELGAKLDSEGLRQLRQRISVRWNLTPLTSDETSAYVRHRLQVAAGAEREIFSAAALREVYRATGGVPRRINLLCDRVMLAGYAKGQHRVGRKLVKQAARELERPSRGVAARANESGSLLRMATTAAAVFMAALLVGVVIGEAPNLSRLLGWTIDGPGLFSAEPQSGSAQEAPVTIDAQAVLAGGAAYTAGEAPAPVGDVSAGRPSAPAPLDVAEAGGESVAMLAELKQESEPIELLASTAIAKPDAPVGTRGERVLNMLAPGSFLGRLLDRQARGRARHLAVNAVLESYGLSTYRDEPESLEESLQWLEQRGLSTLVLEDGDLDTLRVLNHPALLVLRGESDDVRIIALRSLEPEYGVLVGIHDSGGLETALSEIEAQWDGEAYVMWEAFEPIPELLTVGQSGRGIAWLQEALAELGFYQGEITGLFDRTTEAGVMALQSSRDIEPDGAVGPRTQMILYDLLDRYRLPRLVGEQRAGEPIVEEGAG